MSAEYIVEIDLRLHAVRQLLVERRVHARVAVQLHRIADRSIGFRSRNQPEANADSRSEVVAVPQREAVARNQRDLASGGRGSGARGDLRVLERIAAGDQPAAGDAALQAELNAAA